MKGKCPSKLKAATPSKKPYLNIPPAKQLYQRIKTNTKWSKIIPGIIKVPVVITCSEQYITKRTGGGCCLFF